MLESRLALLVQQMGEVADEKREDQGCCSLKRKTNTLELAGLCRGNGDAKIKITAEKNKYSDGNALENHMEIRQGRRHQGRREVGRKKIWTEIRNLFLGTETKQWKLLYCWKKRKYID